MRALLRTALVASALLVCAPAARADTNIDFEQPEAGTQITNQYADVGGPGQGVVFGQLPKGGDGLRPVIKSVGAGTANSGTQVADISTCFTCEQYVPNTTGTFQVPRSKVSVRVGYDGTGGARRSCALLVNGQPPTYCAYVTLTAYDSSGNPIGTPSSSYVRRGDGFHTLLSVQVPSESIIGFRVSARTDSTDNNKPIAIDDLSFDVPMTPPPPDFSVTPATTSIVMGQGETFTDAISVGRLSGSSGPVQLSLAGQLPAGVTASFDPNPATGGQSNLVLHANPDAVANGFNPVTLTITATPADASAGPGPRSADVTLQVRSSFDMRVQNGQTDVDLSACSVDVPIEVDREFSFPGPVALHASGLPLGVQASFTPPQATFPHGSRSEIVAMTLRAPATGAPFPFGTVTVTASAPPLSNRTAQLTVHGTCPEQYDARVTSLQITQGAQSDFLPAYNTARHPPNQYNYDQLPSPAKLRGGGPTVVRVFADEAFGPASGVPAVPAALYGSRYDSLGQLHALPGSPLLPVSGTRNLKPGPAIATQADAADENGAYSFVLPPAWTHGEIAINAIAQPSTGSVGHSVSVCTTDACVANDSMGLTHIPFLEAPPVTIRPVALTVSGRPALPDPESVFKFARIVTPLDLAIQPYAGTVDITDLANTFDACTAAANAAKDEQKRHECSNTADEDGTERVDDWTCDNGTPDNGWNIGVNTGVARGLTKVDVCVFEASVQRNSVVEVNRPLTSVTHEFFHLLGRPHASDACGGADGGSTESWPPDQVGFIQSIGLDTAMGSGINGGPFAVIAGTPPRDGCNAGMGECGGKRPEQRFDLMSYCASDGPNPVTDGNAWVSVRNWNAVLEDHRFHKPVVETRATGPPSLRVGGFVDTNGSATITSVAPFASAGQLASTSAYHLVGTDASAKVLADVPMVEAPMHIDGEQPPLPLVGVIPSAGVVNVAIVKDGATLATRARSASAPTVKISGKPAASKGKATVRWKSGDADGGPLQAAIDYSSNGGKNFHRIFIGPDKHIARVPARYLSRSATARVRVTVNDGFQATSATSARFRAPGAAPDVSILSPGKGFRQPNDAALVLSGQAFDDRGKMLTGKRLSWRMGHRVLGRGRSIAATGLAPGRRRITLVARDGFGRSGQRSVVVRIGAARPIFLTLKAPASVKRAATSLRLKVSASLPSRLLVHGAHVRARRFQVGRRARTLKVRIAKGVGRLSVQLHLTSGRKSLGRTVLIRRR
jgi:hypothetical protein